MKNPLRFNPPKKGDSKLHPRDAAGGREEEGAGLKQKGADSICQAHRSCRCHGACVIADGDDDNLAVDRCVHRRWRNC